ncbi:hypothetical protein AWC38_SpisGene10527 [Stylophora pistillata]|uniref:Uncharacterized protein n=1 Tax=Stylophora pistillata TaxID=50429 RepID=A0A2B4S2F6_STYPI|nr:hypothetical protein AWC38_SpisGene10527 [Stylophora pistillata]
MSGLEKKNGPSEKENPGNPLPSSIASVFQGPEFVYMMSKALLPTIVDSVKHSLHSTACSESHGSSQAERFPGLSSGSTIGTSLPSKTSGSTKGMLSPSGAAGSSNGISSELPAKIARITIDYTTNGSAVTHSIDEQEYDPSEDDDNLELSSQRCQASEELSALLNTLSRRLFDPRDDNGAIKQSMAQKIAESGLSYSHLRVIFKVQNKGAACNPQHASFPEHSKKTLCRSSKAYSRCHCKPLSGNTSERRIVPSVPLSVSYNFMLFHFTTFKLQKLCCASGGALLICVFKEGNVSLRPLKEPDNHNPTEEILEQNSTLGFSGVKEPLSKNPAAKRSCTIQSTSTKIFGAKSSSRTRYTSAAVRKGVHLYSEMDVETSSGSEKERRKCCNDKAKELCENSRYDGLRGKVSHQKLHEEWKLHKATKMFHEEKETRKTIEEIIERYPDLDQYLGWKNKMKSETLVRNVTCVELAVQQLTRSRDKVEELSVRFKNTENVTQLGRHVLEEERKETLHGERERRRDEEE